MTPHPIGKDELREGLCMKCNQEYPVWFAPNELWNPVMRNADGSDRYPFICPTCFAMEAELRGIRPTAWKLTTEQLIIEAEKRAELRGRREEVEGFDRILMSDDVEETDAQLLKRLHRHAAGRWDELGNLNTKEGEA